eukprot:2137913-Alexandrium_andersonii.AAC.1
MSAGRRSFASKSGSKSSSGGSMPVSSPGSTSAAGLGDGCFARFRLRFGSRKRFFTLVEAMIHEF